MVSIRQGIWGGVKSVLLKEPVCGAKSYCMARSWQTSGIAPTILAPVFKLCRWVGGEGGKRRGLSR